MRPLMTMAAVMLVCVLSVQAQDGASVPVIDATDVEQLKANLDKDVIIRGKVSKAAWSNTGRVMEIRFEGVTDPKGFTAVVFDRNRQALDEAYGGDLAQTLTGALVQIKGKLRTYGGRAESLQGRIELTITQGSQITLIEPAPSTQPIE
ncbi:MAG TPA: hypothetical protein PKB10_02110 [Tepidisphaeraceae bacterium]|nr:hypothetical protein [Tepidisphaeraceae bacterium]